MPTNTKYLWYLLDTKYLANTVLKDNNLKYMPTSTKHLWYLIQTKKPCS